jgi:DNA repair protein RadC
MATNILASASYKIPFFMADPKGKYKTNRAITENQIIKAANAILKSRVAQKEHLITCPEDTKRLLVTQMANYEREVFVCLFLDNRHHVISMEEMFKGTIDGTSVYPREVVKRALQLNAAALIVAHNHPSGVTTPSQSDKNITAHLKDALSLMDIRLLDHLIIGGAEVFCMAEWGYL